MRDASRTPPWPPQSARRALSPLPAMSCRRAGGPETQHEQRRSPDDPRSADPGHCRRRRCRADHVSCPRAGLPLIPGSLYLRDRHVQSRRPPAEPPVPGAQPRPRAVRLGGTTLLVLGFSALVHRLRSRVGRSWVGCCCSRQRRLIQVLRGVDDPARAAVLQALRPVLHPPSGAAALGASRAPGSASAPLLRVCSASAATQCIGADAEPQIFRLAAATGTTGHGTVPALRLRARARHCITWCVAALFPLAAGSGFSFARQGTAPAHHADRAAGSSSSSDVLQVSGRLPGQ